MIDNSSCCNTNDLTIHEQKFLFHREVKCKLAICILIVHTSIRQYNTLFFFFFFFLGGGIKMTTEEYVVNHYDKRQPELTAMDVGFFFFLTCPHKRRGEGIWNFELMTFTLLCVISGRLNYPLETDMGLMDILFWLSNVFLPLFKSMNCVFMLFRLQAQYLEESISCFLAAKNSKQEYRWKRIWCSLLCQLKAWKINIYERKYKQENKKLRTWGFV